MNTTIVRSLRLTLVDSQSSKEYRVQITENGDCFALTGFNGRIGSGLTQQDKGTFTSLADAEAAFAKLVNSKTRKGYTPDESTMTTVAGVKERTTTHLPVQLLVPVEEHEIEGLLQDPAFVLQRKFDGVRLLVHITETGIIGSNRRGMASTLPSALENELRAYPPDTILDGEAVADRVHVFDLLKCNGTDLRELPYAERYRQLQELTKSIPSPSIECVTSASSETEKRALLDDLRASNAEGAVFKDSSKAHSEGRPHRGGPARKLKFYESASFLVIDGPVNGTRSIGLGLIDANGEITPTGRVTIPSNMGVPPVKSIAEVRYLYAMPKTNAVYQGVLLGIRDDIPRAECTLDQLKYKGND